MRSVLYPGSFDPVTAGHMDIIRRASMAFDRVVVGILHNPQKPSGAVPLDKRLALLRMAAKELTNVEVTAFSGLLVEAAGAANVDAVLRGIRSTLDTEDELMMARLNRQIGQVETVFMAASPEVSHISATYVRQIARLHGDIRGLVPETVREEIIRLLTQPQ